jgi:hypothetical protein
MQGQGSGERIADAGMQRGGEEGCSIGIALLGGQQGAQRGPGSAKVFTSARWEQGLGPASPRARAGAPPASWRGFCPAAGCSPRSPMIDRLSPTRGRLPCFLSPFTEKPWYAICDIDDTLRGLLRSWLRPSLSISSCPLAFLDFGRRRALTPAVACAELSSIFFCWNGPYSFNGISQIELCISYFYFHCIVVIAVMRHVCKPA